MSGMWLAFIAITLWLGSVAFALGVAYGDDVKNIARQWMASEDAVIAAETAQATQEAPKPEQFSAVPGRQPWSVRRRQLEKQFAAEEPTQEAV